MTAFPELPCDECGEETTHYRSQVREVVSEDDRPLYVCFECEAVAISPKSQRGVVTATDGQASEHEGGN
jgi:hypothetical protein